MNPNEELESAADRIALTDSDLADLLRGITLNNPQPPVQLDPGAEQPYEDEWYNLYGTPDFAYGRALKIARKINAAAQTGREVVQLWIDTPPSKN